MNYKTRTEPLARRPEFALNRGARRTTKTQKVSCHKENCETAKSEFVDASVKRQNDEPARPRAGWILKSALRRAFDVTCAATGLLFLAPLFVIVIVAIKLEDGGPIFFSQLRVGENLKKFWILKFRSMVPNSSGIVALTAPEDPRITRVGRFLRKNKLDELPQLVNVVRGEMQLVGVRPQVERYVEPFLREYSVLLQDRPGITDLASLMYRNEERMFQAGSLERQYLLQILPRKLRIALQYHQARSFFSDMGILFRTVWGLKPATTYEQE